MKKVDKDVVDKYYGILQENNLAGSKNAYGEIEIIREIDNIKNLKEENSDERIENNELAENGESSEIIAENTEPEKENKEENAENETTTKNKEIIEEELEKMRLNMNFLGLDLSQIPMQNTNNWKVYIIPILYVITSFASMKITTQSKINKKNI